jgi:anthranilate phosphoribosyltransferase
MNFTDLLEKLSHRQDLSAEEATYAMSNILSGDVPDTRISAFLFGMRSKGETIDELTAFVRTMREVGVRLDVDVTHAVDTCGTGGDHSGTFNISTASMFVVAGAGVPVLKHGNRSISSRSGSYDVLEKLGAVPSLDPGKVKQCFNNTNMAFMFAPLFHPAMKHVMTARRELGMRTFFNILGPLLNPAGVKRQIIGAYNRDVAQSMSRILANLNSEYAITVHAHDGLDEVTTTTLTDTFELKHSVSSEVIRFDPVELGYTLADPVKLTGGDADENAKIIRSVLEGKGTREQTDIVELNATFAVHVSGKVGSLDDAQTMARESLKSGAAVKALNTFVQCTQDLARG